MAAFGGFEGGEGSFECSGKVGSSDGNKVAVELIYILIECRPVGGERAGEIRRTGKGDQTETVFIRSGYQLTQQIFSMLYPRWSDVV